MKTLTIPTVARITIIVSIVFSVIQFLLYICNCRCKTEKDHRHTRNIFDDSINVLQLLEKYKKNIELLKSRVRILEREVRKYHRLDTYLVSENIYKDKLFLDDRSFLNSYTPRTEFDVIPYQTFTAQQFYGEVGYLSKKPTGIPIGQQSVEMREVLEYAIRTINHDVESKADRVSLANFAEGITRNDKIYGSVYDLYFRSPKSPEVFKRVKLLRPFSHLQSIGEPETLDTSREWINLILTLSGRLEKFKFFMEQFVEVCIRRDRRVFLTIVYFGNEGKQQIKDTILNITQKENYEDYKVIFSEEEFNRGRGLQKGVESWSRGNSIMFFCDVDVYFTDDFLERCRFHTSPGLKVYYPIVFSQYNPEIVFGGLQPPPLREQMYISYESGFWRDFGFGMTCQYRNDFLNVGGFDLSIRGWGGEDTALYKEHLRSKISIIRAYDRSILHIYHPKNCRKTVSDTQFVSCLQSKAVSEGSHKQLGMLAFGSSLISGRDPNWIQKLQSSLSGTVNDSKAPS